MNQKILVNVRIDLSSFLKMEHVIKVNGKRMSDTVTELRFGQMVRNMKGTGKTIKLMEEVSFGTFMEILMRVNGKEIKLMV